MNIGYACLAIAVPCSEMKNCTIKNANDERLLSLIEHNVNSLDRIIDYNIRNDIKLFRISSDLIPFGSSLARELLWQEIFSDKLTTIGYKIRNTGMRVSMHPGQYTVLNSPNKLVAERAIQDLNYHTRVLDSLGLGVEHKIILHLGGAYGDKKQAASRFVSMYKQLNPAVQNRLVLENDDRLFNIKDVLNTAITAGIPAVYDNLHNAVNPVDKSYQDIDWIKNCYETWRIEDGPQKIHYSQQNPGRKPGAHSESIEIDKFLQFYEQLYGKDIDIMLEVKDKNISALKCLNCVSNRGISALETELNRYRYSILERSSEENYNSIRKLLKNNAAYPSVEMYQKIEASLKTPVLTANAANAMEHVWGYLKNKVSEPEKKRFQRALQNYKMGELEIQSVKKILLTLSSKYNEDYLLNAYYFYI